MVREHLKLQQHKNQYFLTIPSAIVRAKNWKKGKKLKIRINNKGNIEIID